MMHEAEYDALAAHEGSHWWYRALRGKVRRGLREAGFPRNGILVDLGCGTGGILDVLQDTWNPRYCGLDPHAKAVAYARPRRPWALLRGRIESQPFKAGVADGVLSLDSLCYGPDPAIALKQIARALKPGGILILNVPAFPSLRGAHDEAVGCRRRFRWSEMKTLLADAQLDALAHEYWNALLFVPLLLWRRLSRIPGQPLGISDVTWSGGMLNAPLAGLIALESGLARLLPLPFGSSLFVVARKP